MHLYFVGLSSLSLIWLLVERFKLPIHGFVKTIFRFSLLFGWGSAWGFYCAHSVLSHQLPDGLDRHDFLVSGTVAQILKTDKVRTNFVVIVDSAAELANPKNIVHLEKLLLNEYSSINKKGRLDIQEGDHWQFVARLKRPRGMFNPGGFDYQSWLVQSGYSATGYVRHNAANRKNHNYPISLYNSVLLGVNKIRSGIRRAIIKSETSELGRAILIALTVGDRQAHQALVGKFVQAGDCALTGYFRVTHWSYCRGRFHAWLYGFKNANISQSSAAIGQHQSLFFAAVTPKLWGYPRDCL